MTRGKQKKNGSSFVNNFTKEDARGRGRGGKRGGKASIQIFDEDEARESKLADGLVTLEGRRKKRGESFQLKYSRRYEELACSEPLHGQKFQFSNSMSFGPPGAKRKSTRILGTGPQNDLSNELEVVNDESFRGKNSGARKNRKMRKSGTQSYNATVFTYGDKEAREKTTTADEVQSSDMDATVEVVLPATVNRAEVVIDRSRNVGNHVASCSPIEGLTWGLGYVKEEVSEKSANEKFKETASASDLVELDEQADSDINPETSDGRGEELVQQYRTRKGRHKSAAKEFGYSKRNNPREDESRRGFLSIGGLKIYTNDVSDTSDDQDSCKDQMDEDFADVDDGYMEFSRKVERGKKRLKDRVGRKKKLSVPDLMRLSAIMLDSTDGDDINETSDSDVSNELVEDYLANCEGLTADIDDPGWVSRNRKSLEYPLIDEMDIPDGESGSSEDVDLGPESHGIGSSGSELENDLKHRYRITADVFGRQVICSRRAEGTTAQGDSDVETEDLEQKAFFGYDSDSSSTGDDREDALLSDDEVRIRDLELDDEARIRGLELEDSTVGIESVNTAATNGFVSGIVNTETIGELVSASVNTEGTVGDLVSASVNPETIGALVSTSINTESIGGIISGTIEDTLPTSSVGTQTLPGSTDQEHLLELGLQEKVPCSMLNMLPKYRSVGQFRSSHAEEVSLACPLDTQIWPVSTAKTVKKGKRFPGQKKMERQETIAMKRRERAVNRGFNIAAVNKELEEMVRLKKDIIAFEPMEQRDRVMVHKLASVYKLKSHSQGLTKRRFVVVSITKNTSMPASEDKVRLLKLLGQDKAHVVENTPTNSRTLTAEEQRKLSKMKRVARQALQGLDIPVPKKGSKYRYFSSAVKTPNTNTNERSAEKSRGRKGSSMPHGQGKQTKRSDKKASKTGVHYANNPVSFIRTGIEIEDAYMTPTSIGSTNPGSIMEGIIRPPLGTADAGSSGAAGRKIKSSDFAGFEAHTNGFASRMMAKMGYEAGHGLGRDKQGIAQPLEAVMRPKSLGLGAHAKRTL